LLPLFIHAIERSGGVTLLTRVRFHITAEEHMLPVWLGFAITSLFGYYYILLLCSAAYSVGYGAWHEYGGPAFAIRRLLPAYVVPMRAYQDWLSGRGGALSTVRDPYMSSLSAIRHCTPFSSLLLLRCTCHRRHIAAADFLLFARPTCYATIHPLATLRHY